MFDPNCWTYWCDECGAELRLNYIKSSEDELILTCKEGHKRSFLSNDTPPPNPAETN